ncbi:acyl-CoA thioesterase [Eubacterium xylanophilum]|uniref:acyl-CoA thioesterase n=1 Tax=Eubacterium xylanophilum TaxID=39497 RepID=UPI00047C119D|nr:acyl-CoA thioesterase [Eubacterium xylanophilum]
MEAYKHKVQYYETDKMGITHHSNYIRWMEEARVYFLEQIGWGYNKMEEEGIGSPVVAVDCKYKKPTTFADEVFIQVKVENCKGVKLKLLYEMTDAQGEICCIGHSEHCFVGSDGKFVRFDKEYPEFYKKLLEFA